MLRYRLFNPDEIKQLLRDAGFSQINIYGGYESIPLVDDCPAMVISAVKGLQ
jgi:hypothetical protein